MFRTTLLTTTCALLISGSAFAQTASPAPMESAPAAAELPVSSQNMFGSPPSAESEKIGFVEAMDGQILVSSFIGQTVYESDATDAATVGKLNDLIVSPDGEVQAAVIGVGGFLGVGEKDVAVSPDQLQLATRSDGKKWLSVKATKDQLTEAPAFDRSALFVDGVADKSATGSNAAPATDAPAMDAPAADPAPAPTTPAPAQ